MKKWIFTTLIGSLLISTQVNARPPQPGPQGMELLHSLKSLSLSQSQRQSIRELLKSFREEHSPNSDEDKNAQNRPMDHEPMDLSLKQITQRASERWQMMKARRIAMASLDHNIWSLLTDEQKQQYATPTNDKKSEFKDRRHERKENKDPQAMIFDDLDLTEEQRTSITAILQVQQVNDESARETLGALQEEIDELVYSTKYTESALSALIDNYEDVFITDAAGRAQTHKKIMALLTDEQKEDLQDILFFKGPKGQRAGFPGMN
ncbi:Spy/CpxP family protein refolding chaperone [Alteromonas sp. 14N.309.X.WAT.G.H12]|uniref:Spy/CpxP family protein refolding chaperone n=1 Tax=Alteromonas sp. 14N.309.X.WAT.G.H12 TaxID=3120824 RepID=UPI002FD52D41